MLLDSLTVCGMKLLGRLESLSYQGTTKLDTSDLARIPTWAPMFNDRELAFVIHYKS